MSMSSGANYTRNLSLKEQRSLDRDGAASCKLNMNSRLSSTNTRRLRPGDVPGGEAPGSGGSNSPNNNNDDQLDNNNRTTESQTMMHILKANIGTGVLAMPLAFKNVGLWLGLALVPLIGAICIHCMNILISSHNNLCDRFNYESLDYDQVAALGLACGPRWTRRLAKRASVIVTIFLMFTQLGFCCVYILFTVENLQVACMNLFQLDYSMITYLLLIFPIIGLTSCTSNLKHLARISTLANILQLAGLALIFSDLLQFHTYVTVASDDVATNATTTSVGQLPVIVVEQGISQNILSGLPLFFATAVYAFEGIGVVLPLVKEMEHPARIAGRTGVLNTSMSVVALLYMAMGFFGYSKYGQIVAGSITLNLPQTTLNEFVRLAFAMAIGLSYSLQFYVPWTTLWPLIDETLFYSYRPRVPRNKLSILDKLSADNHWALQRVLEQEQAEQQRLRRSGTDSNPENDDPTNSNQCSYQQLNDNSTATTFATSYSMSLSVAGPQQQQQQLQQQSQQVFAYQTSRLHLSQQQQQQQQQKSLSNSKSISLSAAGQYGALLPAIGPDAPDGRQLQQAQAGPAKPAGRLRNRLEDVMEQSSDEMPEVQWRPPPRSMRGKRKLVRYTVILLTVSLTFVAAALIPRLDLFISLIGALASSSLAIIFPAIIQLCTFWNNAGAHLQPRRRRDGGRSGDGDHCHEDDADEDDVDDDEDQAGKHNQTVGSDSTACCCRQNRPSSSKLGASSLPLLPNCRDCKRRRRRRWQNTIAWHLFVIKNMFLVLFGVLGLITGTWVSLQQLGATSAQV